jgi:membrane protein implicated in regulation of membrane protease activity
VAVADSTDKQLSWETRQRPRAAAAAILGALLTLAADLWSGAVFRDAPHSGLLEALQSAQRPGAVGTTRSVRDAFYVFYDAHMSQVIGASVLRALGLLAVGWMLTFLAAATRARRSELPRAATWLPLVGAVLQAVATLMGTVASASGVSTYLSGPRTVDAASDVTGSSVLIASSFIGLVGQFALAAAFVLICLNAMRAGLLTRFMGVLGIIVGVLNLIPIGPLPIVQTFWLVALGVLLLGLWPRPGVPPAWRTGRAEPWPSQSETMQKRRAAAEARRGGAVAPVGVPSDQDPDDRASGPGAGVGAARRKRKRRG